MFFKIMPFFHFGSFLYVYSQRPLATAVWTEYAGEIFVDGGAFGDVEPERLDDGSIGGSFLGDMVTVHTFCRD